MHGIAMEIMSVRPSNACIVTKWNNPLSVYQYHTKENPL